MVNNGRDAEIWIPTPAELADAEQGPSRSGPRANRPGVPTTRRRMSISSRVTGEPEEQEAGGE